MHIDRYERGYLIAGIILLALFLSALSYSIFAMGYDTPGGDQKINPDKVSQTPPFDHPGVFKTGPHSYQVVVVASQWQFDPSKISFPAGSTVTFLITSPDVVHGFYVIGTDVNATIIPGVISKLTHTFNKPGTYTFACDEYCGVGHALMYGTLVVTGAK